MLALFGETDLETDAGPRPLSLLPAVRTCRQLDAKDTALSLYALLTTRFKLRVFFDAQASPFPTAALGV